MKTGWVVSVGLLFMGACANETTTALVPAGNSLLDRVWMEVEWQSRVIRGGPDDSLLANPAGLIAETDTLFFFDLYDRRVYALTEDGSILWGVGEEGSGPSEYQHPRDMKLGPHGNLWLLDPEAARVTVLQRDGSTLKMFSLADLKFRPDDIMSLGANDVLLWTMDPVNPLVRLKLDSGEASVVSIDIPHLAERPPMASQAVVSNVESGRWAAALAFGPYFILGDNDGRTALHQYVEPVEFPQVAETTQRSGLRTTTTTRLVRPVFAAAAATISNDTLHVLFGGRSLDRHRIVDRYSATTGRYINSVLLPRAIGDFDYRDGSYYAFFTDVYPYLIRFILASPSNN